MLRHAQSDVAQAPALVICGFRPVWEHLGCLCEAHLDPENGDKAVALQLKMSGLKASTATLNDKWVLHNRIREEQAALKQQRPQRPKAA